MSIITSNMYDVMIKIDHDGIYGNKILELSYLIVVKLYLALMPTYMNLPFFPCQILDLSINLHKFYISSYVLHSIMHNKFIFEVLSNHVTVNL